MPDKHRHWTGNDAHHRHFFGRVPRSDAALFMKLCWKSSPDATPRTVGCFKFNIPALIESKHVRDVDANDAILRFVHDERGRTLIQTRLGQPEIDLGKLK